MFPEPKELEKNEYLMRTPSHKNISVSSIDFQSKSIIPLCYGLNIYVTPKFICDILTPDVMVLEGEVFGG